MASNDRPSYSLEVFLGERCVFASAGRWLHPLFELEELLKGSKLVPQELLASDRIVGKAAALLVARMGIGSVQAGTLSRLGERVLRAQGIDFRYGTLVERIDCATEELLLDVDDLEVAYRLLVARAGSRF